MSAFLEMAETMKDRLAAVPELADVPVLVDRQKDLASEFKKAMAKTKGAAITIFFSSYSTAEEEISSSQVISQFVLMTWTKPVLRSGATPADDLVSEVHKSLHGWVPNENHCRNKAVVQTGRVVPNPQFLIHEQKVKIKHHL